MNKCRDCSKCLELQRWEYSDNGVKHEKVDGFACLVFAHEGLVVNLVGVDLDEEGCEEWNPKK